MTSEQTGADIQVYMFSDLLEGLTVMLIIWWVQDLGEAIGW
jgi:hypothetical protein